MTKVGIINVTGYAGSELARILHNHPEVTITSVTGRSAAGKRLPEAVPHLWDIDLPITTTVEESVDFVFSSLPSGASAAALAPLVDGGMKAVDIAADFRIRSADGFKAAYKIDHPAPHLLERAVYGLPEINRSRIAGASLIANPGCYPEASILALAPAFKEGLVALDAIIDAKSGISGAGRGSITSNPMYHFAESNENVLAYGLEGHGHQPEIAQELAALGGADDRQSDFRAPPDPDDAGHPCHLLRPSIGPIDNPGGRAGGVPRVLRRRAVYSRNRLAASNEADYGV